MYDSRRYLTGVRQISNLTDCLANVGSPPAPRILSKTHTNRHTHIDKHINRQHNDKQRWNPTSQLRLALNGTTQNISFTNQSNKTPNDKLTRYNSTNYTTSTYYSDSDNKDNNRWGGKHKGGGITGAHGFQYTGMFIQPSVCFSTKFTSIYILKQIHLDVHLHTLGEMLGRDCKYTGRGPILKGRDGRTHISTVAQFSGQVGLGPDTG